MLLKGCFFIDLLIQKKDGSVQRFMSEYVEAVDKVSGIHLLVFEQIKENLQFQEKAVKNGELKKKIKSLKLKVRGLVGNGLCRTTWTTST